MALADGIAQLSWQDVEGEWALRYAVPGWPLETKLQGTAMQRWINLPSDPDSLRRELTGAGLPAVLAWHVCIGLALEHRQGRIPLDALIAAIGWDPRTTVERQQMRDRFWRWLVLFDATQVIGKRPGTYKDKRTGQVLELTSIDALLRITGRRLPKQDKLDERATPIEVSFVAGPWLDQYRGNHQVLTYFGDVRKLAAIPAGKPSGAWAQAIGLALQQYWRERAAEAEVVWVGEGKRRHQTLHFTKPITRRELLEQFPPSPTVREVLEGENPIRAQGYWDQAIKRLKTQRLVGYYQPLGDLALSRQGWETAWLQQELDIRPPVEGLEDLAEIAQSRAVARRSHRRGRPPGSAQTRAGGAK